MNNGVIQIGPQESYSISDIAKRIVRISGKNIDIKYEPTMPEGDKDRMADSSKARKILGWQQKISLDDGLQRTYTWASKYLKRDT